MNAYAYPAMVSDYTFLAGMSRKADEFAQGGKETPPASVSAGSQVGGTTPGAASGGKLDLLKRKMREVGLGGCRFLSEGMERRGKNQTRFQAK